MRYEIKNHEMFGPSITGIDDNGTTWGIPMDETNSDYKQYLVDTDGGLPIPEVGETIGNN